MAKLIVREGPAAGASYELVEEVTSIGRDPVNTIQIPSDAVSRTHATLTRAMEGEREGWLLRDLRSKNGTLLNGRRIEEPTPLAPGDEIRLGDCSLLFIDREFDALQEGDLAPAQDLEVRESAGAPAPHGPAVESPQRLQALLELGHALSSARTYADLFSTLCAAVEKNIRPHRVVPILFDERKGLLRPWINQRGEFDRALAKVPISSTVVSLVREKKVGILVAAAQSDRRLREAQSVAAHHITTALCAPMALGERMLGVLYADRLGDAESFSRTDLDLLAAIGTQAAVTIENLRVREEMGRERSVREREARGAYDIVGACAPMQEVFRFIAKAAPAEAGVLIEGESGTGKELVARAIHLNSRRKHQPFETLNCAAMAPSLLESELFGHVKGAFTGADRDRPGRFELADGGTLFLDEIGELPDGSQSKLLRAIEDGTLRRVGDVKDRKVNVRVVAATNKKLADEVAAGRFREDLYFRLNVLRVSLPPLRNRGEDIDLLAAHYLKHFADKCGRPALRFDPAVLRLFRSHEWRGNVRELRNAVERMVVMVEGDTLRPEDVPYEIRSSVKSVEVRETTAVEVGDALPTLRDLEKTHIERVLRHTGGNKKEAARVLGIDRSTLYAKLKAYGMEAKEETP